MRLKLFFYACLSLGIHMAWLMPSLRTSFFQKTSSDTLRVVERFTGSADAARQKRNGGSQSRTAGLLGPLAEIIHQNVKPPYPTIARKLGLEGEAVIEVRVSPSGGVKTIVFKKSSGHAVLDRAIMRTVRHWTIPHHRNQDFWLTLPPFEFRLSQKE